MVELQHMECLQVGGRWMGGSQEWYPNRLRRLSGCGPANAALMVWYLARTRPELHALCDVGTGSRNDFLRLMNEMFGYVKPGMRGVNHARKFARGLEAYAAERGLPLQFDWMETRQNRLPAGQFLLEALRKDRPVAFLNFHSGSQSQLDGWHWMTIIAFDPDNALARCCDQGKAVEFSLNEWHRTSKLGGHFVTINRERAESS